MGDLENLKSLQSMFDKSHVTNEEKTLAKEKRFIAAIAKAYLGEEIEGSDVRKYDPDRLIPYLELPAEEIQKKIGGEWLEMPARDFEIFAYTIDKKLKKSKEILDWKG